MDLGFPTAPQCNPRFPPPSTHIIYLFVILSPFLAVVHLWEDLLGDTGHFAIAVLMLAGCCSQLMGHSVARRDRGQLQQVTGAFVVQGERPAVMEHSSRPVRLPICCPVLFPRQEGFVLGRGRFVLQAVSPGQAIPAGPTAAPGSAAAPGTVVGTAGAGLLREGDGDSANPGTRREHAIQFQITDFSLGPQAREVAFFQPLRKLRGGNLAATSVNLTIN